MTVERFDVERDGQWVIVHWNGEIDLANADEVEARTLEELDNHAQGIVIDLSDVSYVDSSGVRILIQMRSRLAERQQQASIVVPEASVLRRGLEIAGVTATVATFPSVAAALEAR